MKAGLLEQLQGSVEQQVKDSTWRSVIKQGGCVARGLEEQNVGVQGEVTVVLGDC